MLTNVGLFYKTDVLPVSESAYLLSRELIHPCEVTQ